MVVSESKKFRTLSRILRLVPAVAAIAQVAGVHALQPVSPTKFRGKGMHRNFFTRQFPYETSEAKDDHNSVSPPALRMGNPCRNIFFAFELQASSNNNQEENNSNSPSQSSLHEFRKLMGTLYGIAGLAHFIDCYLGPSALLTSASVEPYPNLSDGGKVCVFLWCASGPVAFLSSRLESVAGDPNENYNINPADFGIILYGVVEVGCAILATLPYGESKTPLLLVFELLQTSSVFLNAVAVQVIVALSWVYSASGDMKNNENT